MTAVEWLVSELRKPHADKFITHIIHKALEMEKQQIIEAHGIKENHGFKNGRSWWEQKTGEQYYNETYKPSA